MNEEYAGRPGRWHQPRECGSYIMLLHATESYWRPSASAYIGFVGGASIYGCSLSGLTLRPTRGFKSRYDSLARIGLGAGLAGERRQGAVSQRGPHPRWVVAIRYAHAPEGEASPDGLLCLLRPLVRSGWQCFGGST